MKSGRLKPVHEMVVPGREGRVIKVVYRTANFATQTPASVTFYGDSRTWAEYNAWLLTGLPYGPDDPGEVEEWVETWATDDPRLLDMIEPA